MLRALIENSSIMALARKLSQRHRLIKEGRDKFYRESQLYNLVRVFQQGTGINFRYSFLGRFINQTREGSRVISKNSGLCLFLLSLFKKTESRISGYLKTSAFFDSVKAIKTEFKSPRTTAILLLTIILTNILILLLFNKEISFFSWFVRIIFLLMSIIGLGCAGDRQKLKETSFIAKYINSHCHTKSEIE